MINSKKIVGIKQFLLDQPFTYNMDMAKLYHEYACELYKELEALVAEHGIIRPLPRGPIPRYGNESPEDKKARLKERREMWALNREFEEAARKEAAEWRKNNPKDILDVPTPKG